MTPATPSTTVNGTPAPLKDRLEQTQRDLAALRKQIERATLWTTIIAVLCLVLLTGYFIIGYRAIAAQMEPQALVASVEGIIDEQKPQVKKALADRIKENAPQMALNLSKQLLENMPQLREQLETLVLDQLTDSLKEADLLTEKQFQQLIKDNRPLIEAKLRELAKNEKLSKASMAELEAALEKVVQTDIKERTKSFLNGVNSLNKRLKRLKANKGLTLEEQQERQLVMIARHLQQENLDPALANLPLPSKTPEGPVAIPKLKNKDEKPKAKEDPKSKSKEPKPKAKEEPKPKAKEEPKPKAKEEPKPK